MIIKKLELQGFKSFVERTKIVFHPGITAIVGPNGTGKSNLVDALLWVLGGHRQRTVRGDRTDDIIFNGNAKRPPVSMADVVLSLGGEDGEMAVSHRAFRSGESEYRLDGKGVRLRDIQEELWKHSIGEAEYFVIEQGAIGTFVTSKPLEKRALLEEAAGTAYYKDRKRQALNKLETSEQNMTRLEDIISEVEKAKNSLQRQASAANRYRRLRERIRELTSFHYLRKDVHLVRAQAEAAAAYDACLEKERGVMSRIKAEEHDLAGVRKTLWDLEKALKESQERVYAVKSQAARLEGEIERETKRAEFLEESRRKAAAAREDLRAEMLALELESVQARSGLEGMTADLDGRRSEVEASTLLVREAKGRTAAHAAYLQTLRDEHLRAFQELTEKRNESVKIEKELELVLRQEEKLRSQASGQTALLAETEAALAGFESEIASREGARAGKERSIAALQSDLASARAAADELRARIAALKESRVAAVHQLQALRTVDAKERAGVAAEDIPGSFGLLADLVRTSAEDAPLFDVFWKDEAKARVILPEEFLKALRPGLKGSYLLVPGRVRSAVPPEVLGDPEVVGLLKGRVRTGDRFRDHLDRLDEAVIVREAGAAVRLWLRFPGLNFITPSGDLLLASGLLRLGAKGDGMIALTQEIRGLEERAARLDDEIVPPSAALEAKEAECRSLEAALERERASLLEEEHALQDRIRERKFGRVEMEKASTSAEIIARELGLFSAERGSMTRNLEALRAAAAAAVEVERALAERAEAARRELAAVQEKDGEEERLHFGLKAACDLLAEKMNGLNAQIQSLARRKETTEAKIASFEAEIREAESGKDKLGEYIRELTVKTGVLEEESAAGEKSLDVTETSLRDVRKRQDELEARLQAAREDEEAAKDARVKAEIRKAEIDRDLVNLEETCWQDLKKTLAELRVETETAAAAAAPGAGEAAELEEEILPDDEEAAEEAQPAAAEATGAEGQAAPASEGRPAPAAEPAKPRRAPRKLRPVAELSDEEVEKELDESRDALLRFKAVNLMAEEEYLEQKKRFDFLSEQRKDLRDSIDATGEAIRKIDEESKNKFLKALEEVNKNFREVFALVFKGGHAEVKLLEPDNALESGVEIVAQPPGKRVQNLALLSGGEKSLTSMAFMFALFRYRPSPFCFLDEVDAALDDVNLGRFLDLMKAIKHQTQFIIITHNYKTMEVADYIYGTTMEEPNITKVYSVKMERKEELKADA
jgi:chromosome segregation protein